MSERQSVIYYRPPTIDYYSFIAHRSPLR